MKNLIREFSNVSAFLLIAYASYLLILLSLPYLSFQRDIEFLETKQLVYHIKWWRYSFYFHVFSSPIVIITGLLQFNRLLIERFPTLHRLIGYTYITFTLLISAPSALIMAFYANSGYPAQISFVILSILWIIFTALALLKAKNGKYEKHVKWAMRSYALTLSAVTLRFYAYLFDVFNVSIPPRESYILLSYLSWIPNLLLVEILIRLKYVDYLLKRKVKQH